jgi:hypothetical protein
MSSSIRLGKNPRGLADRSGLPRVCTVVHFVGPPVVIALHSNGDTVLGEELVQLLGFSVTQVWPRRCNFSDLWSSHSGWGHQRDWLTVCLGGSFRELLLATSSMQDPHEYLPTVSERVLAV